MNEMRIQIACELAGAYNVGLTTDGAEALASIMKRSQIEKGASVTDLHRHNRYMYYIERGLLRQFYYKEGRDITEHFGIENDVMFCIESLFLDKPSEQGIEAIEPSIVHRIDYAAFTELSCTDRNVGMLYQRVMEKALVISQHKADSWRFESSQERYSRFCREYPDVARRASVAHIASYLLMSPETLSRVRAGLL